MITYILEKRAIDMVARDLSRMNSIAIEKEPRALSPFDIMVRVSEELDESHYILAAEVKASDSEGLSKKRFTFSPSLRGAIFASKIPVCLFVANVEDDSIYSCWLKEPVWKLGKWTLENRQLHGMSLEKSTKASLIVIIETVRKFYSKSDPCFVST
jgi:hypothetical protein